MPVIPNFSAFAPTPNLAGSWLNGINVANRASEVNAQLNLEQQKINQQAQSAAMEASIQQQRLQEASLRAEQEMKIKSQYDQQMLGLKSQELQGQQAAIQLRAQEAAQKFAAQQEYEAGLRAGGDKNELFMRLGPRMGMHGSEFNDLLGASEPQGASVPPEVYSLAKQGLPGRAAVKIGKNQWTIQNEEQNTVPQQKLDQSIAANEDKQALTMYVQLQKQQTEDFEGRDAYQRKLRGDKLDEADEFSANEYETRAKMLRQITKGIGEKIGAEVPDSVRKSEPEYERASEVPVGGKYKGMIRLPGKWNDKSSWKKI